MKIDRLLITAGISALVFLGCGASRAQAQVTLLDGGFELPALAANSFVAGGGTSWTPTGNDFVISNDYNSYGDTPYGTQYLDLNQGGAADSQTVTGFVAGQTYVLGANFAEILPSVTPLFTLSVSGAAVSSSTFTGAVSTGPYGTGTFPFQSAVIVFTALTSGSATITLTNSSTLPLTGNFPAIAVDNVSLYGGLSSTPTVPEPGTTGAILLGAGALAVVAVRRRTQSA